MVRTAELPDGKLLSVLPKARSDQAQSLLRKKLKIDEAADLVAALDFQDLLYIARTMIALDALSTLTDEQIRGLSSFRNSVMHAVLDPAGDESGRIEHLLTYTAHVAQLLHSVERAG